MRKRTIVLIGAGSVSFTKGLVADIILEGSPWDVRLVDISEENLAVAYGLAKRMVEAKGAPIKLTRTTDRREALEGADVVVTTIAVGGRRAWEKDVFIPRKYGIFQPVGDTIMPGGISRALRMIPPMVDIAKDVSKLAPEAKFFNYANPMAANCRAIRKATGVPVVGLCHGVPHTARTIANLAGVPMSRFSYTAVGMNHLTWFMRMEVDGKDALGHLKTQVAKYCETKTLPADCVDHNFTLEMLEIFDAFPAVMDRHICEFFPQFFRTGEHYGKHLGMDRFSFERTVENGDKGFRAMADQAEGRAPLDETVFQRKEGEHEQLLDILNALEGSEEKVFYMNVPNEGQVLNLGRDFVIECPVKVSLRGMKPIQLGTVPTGVRATVEKSLLVMELAVEAALERSHKKLIQALIFDGSVKSVVDAEKLARELVAAHREYLPGW